MSRVKFVYLFVSLCLLFVVANANFLSLLPKKNDPSPSFAEKLSILFNPFQQFQDIGKSLEELAYEQASQIQKEVESFARRKSSPNSQKSVLSNYYQANEAIEPPKTKRSVEGEVDPTTVCINQGYKGNLTKEENKCQSNNCTVAELDCNGVIVDVIKDGPPASISGCLVTKLHCMPNGTYTYSVADSCSLQKVLCNNVTQYSGDQITPQMINTCQVQIGCGFKFYGFEVFDYYCANEELECNGAIVTDPTGRPVNETQCRRVNTPCTDVSAESQCTSIGEVCPGSIIDTLCSPITLNGTCQNSKSQTCVPKIIQCAGENYDWSNYDGAFLFCENILSVSCDNQVTSLHSENDFCRVTELTCNGQVQPFLGDIPANCSISKIICANRDNVLDCKTFSLGCQNINCVYQKEEYSCHNNCKQKLTISNQTTYEGCICPVDFQGDTCATPRPFTCELFKVSPEEKCVYQKDAETGLIYDQDPVCYTYKMNDTILFEFFLSCGFADSNYRINQTKEGNFTYLVVTEKLALSRMPPWALKKKIFNFVYLSDNEENRFIPLTQRQIATKDSIKVSWSPKDLDPSRFIFGKRIYTETRMASDSFAPILGERSTMHKMIFDITDAPFVSAGVKTSQIAWGIIIVATLGILVLVAIIGSIIYFRCRK